MKDRVAPLPFSGRYPGYTVVAASFIIQGTIVGAIFTYGVFFDALQADLGWSRAVIAAGSSLTSLVMGIGAMVFGRLTDLTGPRRILSATGVLITLGYLLMSRITAPWHLLLVYPLFVGVAFAGHDVVTLSTVARWFDRRRGRMSAIVKAGTGLGQVIGPAVAAVLIAAFGWRTAYLWIAAVTGPLVFLAARCVHRSPDATGVPHGDLPIAPPGSPAEPAVGVAPPPASARQMMRRPEFRRLGIAQGVVFFCAPTIIVHIVPYATDMGIDRTLAAGVLSVLGGVSIAGRLLMGSVIDRVGGRIAILGCHAIMLLAFILLQFADNAPMLYLFAIVYGFAHGGLFTAVSPLVAELFGMRAHGLLYGTVIFIGTIAGAIGPTVAGAIYDLTGSYRPAFLLLIVLVLVAAGTVASIRPRGRTDAPVSAINPLSRR
ncbi:MAG: MFS transporter [Spirochaetaceae bacterium]|nr:MAG: MFS transporter [Spirochaetaceae bacterium]